MQESVNLLQPDPSLMWWTLALLVASVVAIGWGILCFVRVLQRSSPRQAERDRERMLALAERVEELAESTRRLEEGQRFTTAMLGRERPHRSDSPAS